MNTHLLQRDGVVADAEKKQNVRNASHEHGRHVDRPRVNTLKLENVQRLEVEGYGRHGLGKEGVDLPVVQNGLGLALGQVVEDRDEDEVLGRERPPVVNVVLGSEAGAERPPPPFDDLFGVF